MGALFSSNGIINTVNAQSNFIVRILEWLTKLSHKYSENGLDRQKRVDVLAGKLKSIVERTYGSQEKLTAKKAEMEAKAKEEADEKKKQKEADKATAKVARDAQKSTESNESAEGKQTPAEAEKGAEMADNDVKMSVVGENSETADLSALDIAIAMHKADPNADTVSETGWWKGKDGKWRYEISDQKMKFRKNGFVNNSKTLGDYVRHDKLFESYPMLRDIPVKFVDVISGDPNTYGEYDFERNAITLKNDLSNDQAKRTLLHEIQHAVQSYEGFIGGSSSETAGAGLFNMAYENVKNTSEYKMLKTPTERARFVEKHAKRAGEKSFAKRAFNLYFNYYGEVEARTVAERMKMSERKRVNNPIHIDGYTYSTEKIKARFVDNLRAMGYNENQINEILERGDLSANESGNVSKSLRQDESVRGVEGASGRLSEESLQRGQTDGVQWTRNAETRARNEADGLLRKNAVKHSISPEADASYLSAVENGDMETAQRMVDEAAKDIRYSLSGYTADGIEVYETSEEVLNLPWKERKKRYLSFIEKQYRGRTAKFERNGHVYYAEFDRQNASKAIFGDSRSDDAGRDALINTGADGDIFELVENSNYDGSGKDKKNHNNTDYFDYFVKTVQIDGKVFDLLADVKKQYGKDGGYVYTIRLVENKNIKASPIQRGQALLKNSGNALIDNTIVTQDDGVVNTEYMQNPEKNSDRRMSTVSDDAETSSQDYLEMIAETKAKKESNATLVEKLLSERGTRIEGASVPEFLKNLIASYESEAWYGNVEKKYHELFDKVYGDKGGKIDVKTVTDMFREI